MLSKNKNKHKNKNKNKLNKKALIKTIESVVSGLLIVGLTILIINSMAFNKMDEKIHISRLLEDPQFRADILSNSITNATELCNQYFNKLQLNCFISTSNIQLRFENKKGKIYNLFFAGNSSSYNPTVARIFLSKR